MLSSLAKDNWAGLTLLNLQKKLGVVSKWNAFLADQQIFSGTYRDGKAIKCREMCIYCRDVLYMFSLILTLCTL